MTASLVNTNALHLPFADKSIHCAVTSPPYWGLRDYGNPDQLGLEPTPEEYVANMVAVFREVWRVLRDDGTLWLNLGDSYASSTKGSGGSNPETSPLQAWKGADNAQAFTPHKVSAGVPDKNLIGIPWLVAFALQRDGWYLRQDIIWQKPNPMPESVRDRCTKAHEYIFLLSKSPRYFYDQDAIRQPHSREWWSESVGPEYMTEKDGRKDGGKRKGNGTPTGSNRRSVWSISTKPFPGAHFATFPPELPELCIKAGTSERGVCPECGAPWERVVEKTANYEKRQDRSQPEWKDAQVDSSGWRPATIHDEYWQPTCDHEGDPVPAKVLDPFGGSGTTAMVARQLGRHGIAIDISPEYLQIARERLGFAALDAWNNGSKPVEANIDDLPLFAAVRP